MPPEAQSQVRRSGIARVFVDPAPDNGAHHGYRGPIDIDECGVHIGSKCEVLTVDNEGDDWPMGDWSGVEMPCLLPWHRIYSLEWQDQAAAALNWFDLNWFAGFTLDDTEGDGCGRYTPADKLKILARIGERADRLEGGEHDA